IGEQLATGTNHGEGKRGLTVELGRQKADRLRRRCSATTGEHHRTAVKAQCAAGIQRRRDHAAQEISARIGHGDSRLVRPVDARAAGRYVEAAGIIEDQTESSGRPVQVNPYVTRYTVRAERLRFNVGNGADSRMESPCWLGSVGARQLEYVDVGRENAAEDLVGVHDYCGEADPEGRSSLRVATVRNGCSVRRTVPRCSSRPPLPRRRRRNRNPTRSASADEGTRSARVSAWYSPSNLLNCVPGNWPVQALPDAAEDGTSHQHQSSTRRRSVTRVNVRM